jgi:hypothetical protein
MSNRSGVISCRHDSTLGWYISGEEVSVSFEDLSRKNDNGPTIEIYE